MSNRKKTKLLRQGRCPHCGEKFKCALWFDGEAEANALLCPVLHHGFLYRVIGDGRDLELWWRQLDNDGDPMIVPEGFIRWLPDNIDYGNSYDQVYTAYKKACKEGAKERG